MKINPNIYIRGVHNFHEAEGPNYQRSRPHLVGHKFGLIQLFISTPIAPLTHTYITGVQKLADHTNIDSLSLIK